MSDLRPEHLPSQQIDALWKKHGVYDKLSSKPQNSEFKDLLSGFIHDVNDLQLQAKDQIEKLATGEVKDLHQVLVASTEADTSFKIMMDIRNRLMAAYKEIKSLK